MNSYLPVLALQQDTALRQHHADVVNEFSRPALARRSEDLYRQFSGRFIAWCHAHDYPDTVPVDPDLIIAWLSDMAEKGNAVSTIGVALCSVKYLHAQSGVELGNRRKIANALRHIRRRYGRAQDQAEALKPDLLGEILRTAPKNMLDTRDYAMLALAYVFALRRSELISLDHGESGDGGGVLTISMDSVRITLHRSKESQEAPEAVAIPRDANPRAVGAVDRWIRDAAIAPGTPIVRALTARGGHVRQERLSADMAARAMRACIFRHLIGIGMSADDAREKASGFSGHSGRVGFVVSATEAGARHEDIAKVTRHRPNSTMLRRYGEQADQLRTSPHRLNGVGV